MSSRRYLSARGGLTALGAGLVLLLATTVGAGFDLLTSASLGWGTSVMFIAGAALVALRARRRDLAAAAILPPLCLAAVLIGVAVTQGMTSLSRLGLNLLTNLTLLAPGLWLGSALAGGVALLRWRRATS